MAGQSALHPKTATTCTCPPKPAAEVRQKQLLTANTGLDSPWITVKFNRVCPDFPSCGKEWHYWGATKHSSVMIPTEHTRLPELFLPSCRARALETITTWEEAFRLCAFLKERYIFRLLSLFSLTCSSAEMENLLLDPLGRFKYFGKRSLTSRSELQHLKTTRQKYSRLYFFVPLVSGQLPPPPSPCCISTICRTGW